MTKMLEKLKSYLPVSRKVYEKDIKAMLTTIEGLMLNETQHTQMEMNIIQQINQLKQTIMPPKDIPKKTNKKSSDNKTDVAFM